MGWTTSPTLPVFTFPFMDILLDGFETPFCQKARKQS
jgi:hypothetical protein